MHAGSPAENHTRQQINHGPFSFACLPLQPSPANHRVPLPPRSPRSTLALAFLDPSHRLPPVTPIFRTLSHLFFTRSMPAGSRPPRRSPLRRHHRNVGHYSAQLDDCGFTDTSAILYVFSLVLVMAHIGFYFQIN
jgi:hypothetical protein